MTSPALLYLSLDTHSTSEAFTALGITSRFMHADRGEPTRRERGNATVQLAGPNVFGFPPAGRASPLLAEESQ